MDTIDCVSWRADLQRRAVAWLPGDTVELEGSLRRRFWRSPGGPASRSEVEVVRGRRLRKAPVVPARAQPRQPQQESADEPAAVGEPQRRGRRAGELIDEPQREISA